MERPQKITINFILKGDKYFASVSEYPFIYADGYTLNDTFGSLMEFLKDNQVYDDGIPIYIDERCQLDFINLGLGKESILQMEKIKNRLHYGFIHMSGLQQGHQDIEKEDIEKGEEKIKDVLRDIAASFGYKIEIEKLTDKDFIKTNKNEDNKETSKNNA
jgi:hypothetical protein